MNMERGMLFKNVKKALGLFLCVVMTVCLLQTKEASASRSCTHKWGSWITDQSATCTSGGQKHRKCSSCGKTETQRISALGHSVSGVTKTVDSTCTSAGYRAVICNRCGAQVSKTTIAAKGHSYGNWITDRSATCEGNGAKHRNCTRCGARDNGSISALGHSANGQTTTVQATCTSAGYTAVKCSRCGKELSRTTIAAKGHSWGNWITDRAATCESDGAKHRVCSSCNTRENGSIPKLGHLVNGQTTTVQATCTSAGYTAVKCSRCGKEMSRTTIAAKGHSWGNWVSDKAATCDTAGTKHRNCSTCGARESGTVSALGHVASGQTSTVAATCTSAGYTAVKCSRCGKEMSRTTIPAKGHSFGNWTVTKAADCTNAGSKIHTCGTCGAKETATIAALGHLVNGQTKTVAATCTKDGYTSVICSRCGKEAGKTTIPAKGHTFGNWTIVKEANCTTAGSKTHTCNICGTKETVSIAALGHLVNGQTKTVAATCTKPGYTAVNCSRCGKEVSRTTIAAKGHAFGSWTVTKEATCTKNGSKTHTCNTCGTKETVSIAALGHLVNGQTKTVAATCTKDGYTAVICSRCGKEASRKTIAAKGHTFGSWIVTKKATCTEDGEKTHTCSACGLKKTVTVAALGHSSNGQTKKVAATCTKAGYTAVVCSRCGKEVSRTTIAPKGHSYSSWIIDRAATCETAGAKHRICSSCNERENSAISKLGHLVNGQTKTVPATCVQDGYKVVVCSRCGKEQGAGTVIPATGVHTWGSYIIDSPASCLKAGTKHHVCTVCGTSVSESIPPTGHTVEGQIKQKKATCEEDGYKVVICSSCGTEVGEKTVIPKTGHKLGRIKEITPASCKNSGLGLKYCTNGNCSYCEKAEIPKKNHIPRPFTEAGTCLNYGKQGTKCELCGEILGNTVTLPKTDHVYGDWEYNEKASSSTDDVYFRYCIYCGKEDRKDEEKEVLPEYYVIFDSNGGKGKMPISYFKGNLLYLPACSFTKDTYKFSCWSTDPDSSKGMCFGAGEAFERIDAPCTLYAIWEPIIYSIKYNYNYPGAPEPATEMIMYGVETKLPEPTRKGYEFLGWKGVTDGSQVYYTPGKIVKNLTVHDNVTVILYAQWQKKAGTYTVSFYDGDTFLEEKNTENGTSVKTPLRSKNGSCCVGWSKTKGGTTDYFPETNYVFGSDIKLYAVWNYYTVSYDANGGKNAPKSQTVKDGSTLILSSGKPTRDGYVFFGWSYTKTDQGIDFYPGDEFTDLTGVTLYAVWSPIEYTIKVDLGYVRAKTYKITMLYDYAYCLETPTRKGYEFTYWTGIGEGGKPLYFKEGAVVKNLTSKADVVIHLEANWKRKNDYIEVKCFDGNKEVDSVGAYYGSKICMPSYKSSVSGKKICQWNTKKDGTGIAYQPGKYYELSESINVYAVWGTYSISYNANGGKNGPGTEYFSEAAVAPITSKKPIREGYEFLGWAYAKYASTSDFVGGDVFREGMSIELYAVWKPVQYTIRFDLNYPGAPKMADAAGMYDNEVYLKKPEREGFVFTGWKGYYGGRIMYFPGDQYVRNLATTDRAVICLTAQWTIAQGYYQLTFKHNGKVVICDAVEEGKDYKLPDYWAPETTVLCTGWKYADNPSKEYDRGTKVTVTGDTVFEAVWDTYTIRFDTNGTGVTGMPGWITTTQDKSVTIPDTVPLRNGYQFAGWGVMGPQGDVSKEYDPGDIYDCAVDITLHAVWDEIIVSPLKEILQSKYSAAIMKDEYFTTNYTSPGWQKVNDSCYFLIKTDISAASYDTDAFILYKDNYTIKVIEYTDCDGILSTMERKILENMDNTWGPALASALKFTVKFIDSKAKAAVAGSCPAGMIIVTGYDLYCLVKEGIETYNNGSVFAKVTYPVSVSAEAEDIVIDFELAECVEVAGVASKVLGWVEKIYNAKMKKDQKAQILEQNVDTYGNKDIALQTFADSIKKAGFSSAVYDTGLKNVVNSLYGE